jgi:hypothetical protein
MAAAPAAKRSTLRRRTNDDTDLSLRATLLSVMRII